MATQTLTTSEQKKLAVLMRMARTNADAAGAEPDAARQCGTAHLCMTCRVAIFCSHRRSLPALF
jgi:hypothetical protein